MYNENFQIELLFAWDVFNVSTQFVNVSQIFANIRRTMSYRIEPILFC